MCEKIKVHKAKKNQSHTKMSSDLVAHKNDVIPTSFVLKSHSFAKCESDSSVQRTTGQCQRSVTCPWPCFSKMKQQSESCMQKDRLSDNSPCLADLIAPFALEQRHQSESACLFTCGRTCLFCSGRQWNPKAIGEKTRQLLNKDTSCQL